MDNGKNIIYYLQILLCSTFYIRVPTELYINKGCRNNVTTGFNLTLEKYKNNNGLKVVATTTVFVP